LVYFYVGAGGVSPEKAAHVLAVVPMLLVLKYSARALALASIASLVVAILVWEGAVLGSTAPGDFRIEPAIQSLGELAPGSVLPVTLRATNRSSRPIRVIGIGETCARWGCVRRATGLPCVVPPHAAVEFGFRVITKEGNRAGDAGFDCEVAVYSDCPGKTITAIRLSGKIRRDDGEK
jgi:hypothetical protein